jgi:hypothetical protein
MAKSAPKRVQSSPVSKHAEDIWDHLDGWHGATAAKDLREFIEGRVTFLSRTKGIPSSAIYAALAAGVRVVRAHHHRLHINALERGIAGAQRNVWRALDKAVKELESWIAIDPYSSEDEQFGNSVQQLRELRDDFATSPLPIFSSRRTRLARAGRPALGKRADELLRRARVSKEERAALLKAVLEGELD